MPKNFPQMDIEGRLYTDSIANAANIDSTTNAINTIDHAHQEVHEGNHYSLSGFIEIDTGVVHRIKMVTPDSKEWMHLTFNISSSGVCSSTLDEGAAGGMADGSPVTPINNNRNSSNASGIVFTSGVGSADGYDLRVENDKWGADSPRQIAGGGTGREDEIILKQNTTYLRTFTSFADNNIIQFKASWYEHTNL